MFRCFTGIGLALAIGMTDVATRAIFAQDDKKKDDKHEHPSEGPHHGVLAEWGEEEYHVEFTVDRKNAAATVYILDGSAKKAKPIDSKEVTLTLKASKGKKAVSVDLKPKPEKGDGEGKSSRFSGKHKALGAKEMFSGTLSAEVGGKPYSGDFKEVPHDHKHDHKDGDKHDHKHDK